MVPHMVPIFPNQHGKPLSDATLSQLIKELGIAAVPHGFRSSFRDWAAERTSTPREVVEAALAHTVLNPTDAAYAHSDLFERRWRLMNDRATYVDWCGVLLPKTAQSHADRKYRPLPSAKRNRANRSVAPLAAVRSPARKIGRRTANVPGITTVNSVVFRKSFTSCHPTRPEIQIAPSIPVRVTSRFCAGWPRRPALQRRPAPSCPASTASVRTNDDWRHPQDRTRRSQRSRTAAPVCPTRPSTPWIWRRPPWSASPSRTPMRATRRRWSRR